MKFASTALLLALLSSVAAAKDVNLKWKNISGAKKYNLEVSEDSSFSDVVFSKSVSQPNYVRDLKAGIYFLRVQGVDQRGRAGLWSPAFKLVVTSPIKPLEDAEAPKKIFFVTKKPELDTSWKAPDSTTSFRVKVTKDGKEVLHQETSTPHINFRPDGPGEYKVEVSSGYKQYFGPPVTVSTIHVEKKNLDAPLWETPTDKKFSSRRPINLSWASVESAASYKVKIFRVSESGSRNPASDVPVFSTEKLENNQLIIDPMPPGKYYANVESISDSNTTASSTRLEFDVKRGKPVEFERFDISAKYNISPVNYRSSMTENGGDSTASGLGGSFQIDGNLWLPESNWGVRAGGTWGGFTVSGVPITYNDLQAAAQYRLIPSHEGLRTEYRGYLGARAWTIPIIVGGNSGGSGNSSPQLQVFPVTLVGPVVGTEITKPFTTKLAAVGRGQLSFPVTNSSFGNGVLGSQKVDPSVPSVKVEMGLKYALPGTLRVLAMAGYTDDEMSGPAIAGVNWQGAPVPGTTDRIALKYPTFTLGIEASDDGPLFGSTGTSTPRKDRFSDFDFSMRYTYSVVNYTSTIIEQTGQSVSVGKLPGGDVSLDGRGWFRDSKHGIRVSADWAGFNDQGAYVAEPEFAAQWAFRPVTKPSLMGWNWNNFFGLRSWSVPIIGSSSGSGGPAATVLYQSPELLGPEETFVLMKGFSETWSGRFVAEISTPLLLANKQSTIDHPVPDSPSYHAEIDAIKSFSPDFSVGLGAGYTMNSLKYVPTITAQTGGSGFSIAQVGAPNISAFATYSF